MITIHVAIGNLALSKRRAGDRGEVPPILKISNHYQQN
jgi:hypothetical protein